MSMPEPNLSHTPAHQPQGLAPASTCDAASVAKARPQFSQPAEPGPPEEVREELRRALCNDAVRAARVQYVSAVLAVIIKIEDWLAIDSWLGGGKVEHTERSEAFGEAFHEFRAVSTVVCMAAELAEAALAMVEKRRYYAVAAVIRQLIECEYLLTLFNEDLNHARSWQESTPEAVRKSFTPSKMRSLTGRFSNEEYWNHCSTGGHPAPKGAQLLEKLDPKRQSWPYAAAELTIDLGLHLQRIWAAIDALLLKHHARYGRIFTDQSRRAAEAWSHWQEADPVAAALIEWSGTS